MIYLYTSKLCVLELRQALSRHLGTLGIDAPPSCILITSGALQALQLISACLLPKDSTVFTEAPTYLKSLQIFQSAGMELSGLPMDREGLQYWKLPVAMKTDSRQTSSILYTIPTNQNPTGTTMTDGRRRDLLNFCVKNRLPIIEDGAYHELCCDFQPPAPIKAMDKTGNVIYIGSASKTLAPGLRIGWLVAPEPVACRLGDVKMQTDYGASSISQWIFAEFLSSGLYSQYLKSLKRELQKRRDSALAALENCFKDIADWNTPSGGFYIWLTFKKRISMDSLFEKAARAGILLNSGDIYDFGHNNSLRLSYAYASCEEFKMAAEKLAGLVGALTFD